VHHGRLVGPHRGSANPPMWVPMAHLIAPIFQRIPSANYRCAQDVHITHIVTNMENIKSNALLYIDHSYNKTYNYYKSIAETILDLLFEASYSTGTVN
jgi:hypothetical protein